MSNAEETRSDSELTMDEALAARAADFKKSIDWARTRLDRAASLVALATEPSHPAGRPSEVHEIADALHLAEMLQVDVFNGMQEVLNDSLPSVTFLANQAFDRLMSASTEAEMDRWSDNEIRSMTVAELTAALKEEPAAVKA